MSLGILRILGIIVFLYLTWRNLKDDYTSEKVITYGWLALVGFLVLGRVGFGVVNFGIWKNWSDWLAVWNKPGMSYVAGFLGLAVATWLYGLVNEWKFLAFMEDNLSSVLAFLWFLMADEFLRARMDLRPLIYLVILIVVFLISRIVSKKYRSFVWYRSGKKGFVFLFSVFLAFLLLAIGFGLMDEGLVSVVLSLIISLISLITLFILGKVKRKI